MHPRSLRPTSRARFAALTAAAVLGLGTALLGTSPALAATTPTLSGPATTVGYGPVTLTGTARPGATVTLIEAAYVFRGDMNPAQDYANGDVIVTTADSSGHFTLRRTMDSGFVFAAEADGLRSDVITIAMIARPTLALTTSGTTISVTVYSDPGQPWLPVAVQRQSGSGWTTVAEGSTAENGVYQTSLTGLTAGQTQYYRAEVGPDAENAIRTGHSTTVGIVVGGSGTPITEPTPAPPPGPALPTPPKAGDVRFTLVQYNPPGTDRASNAGYNLEYFRITNNTARTLNLKYWTVKDRAGNTYRFSADFPLAARRSVYVLTGKGTNGMPSNYRYWGRTGYVWNNGGDAAYLRTGSNQLIDTCTWGSGSGKTYC